MEINYLVWDKLECFLVTATGGFILGKRRALEDTRCRVT